jgi:aspartate-semialdehyde dehydrogenase
VVGASGILGTELIGVLEERRFPLADLVPVGTERSMGGEIEFQGDLYPLLTELPRLSALDVLFLCAPQSVCLDHARDALRESVSCLDLSGALAGQPDVPLLVAEVACPASDLARPLVATPAGMALALCHVLVPLQRDAGLRRVVATTLEAVSGAGQEGMESLSREVLAIFNQEEAPEPAVFDRAVAFDCLPRVGETGDEGSTEREDALARDLGRLLGRKDLPVAATAVRVPTFAGHGVSLALELERPLEASEASEILAKASGVVVEDASSGGPSLRGATGRDDVLVGRLRRDLSVEAGLLLWVAADAVRLAAANAVKLVEARLERS